MYEIHIDPMSSGAMGYHLKDSSPEALVDAIRQVFHGESSLHPLIAKKVLDEFHASSERQLSTEPLTPRELEVLRLIAQGSENQEIAGKLVVSEATVRTHISNIMGKLHLASRTQAALYALREGLASLGNQKGMPSTFGVESMQFEFIRPCKTRSCCLFEYPLRSDVPAA